MPAAPPKPSATAAQQIAGFIAKFDPPMARRIRECRVALRKRFPTAIELVYDNYNFLVFGFCTAPRASECIVSLTAYARGVGLCFIYGAKLPDPTKRLQGSGNQVRSISLEGASTLKESAVEALIKAAIAQHRSPLPERKGTTIIQSISAKQRPRSTTK